MNTIHPLDHLLLAVWEVPQASTGFPPPPFELLFGRKTQGVLDLIKKKNKKKLGGRSKPISKNEIQKTWEQSY